MINKIVKETNPKLKMKGIKLKNIPDKNGVYNRAFVTNLSNIEIPKGIHEALGKPEWNAAIWEEMSALKWNGTWNSQICQKGNNL